MGQGNWVGGYYDKAPPMMHPIQSAMAPIMPMAHSPIQATIPVMQDMMIPILGCESWLEKCMWDHHIFYMVELHWSGHAVGDAAADQNHYTLY